MSEHHIMRLIHLNLNSTILSCWIIALLSCGRTRLQVGGRYADLHVKTYDPTGKKKEKCLYTQEDTKLHLKNTHTRMRGRVVRHTINHLVCHCCVVLGRLSGLVAVLRRDAFLSR